MPLLYHMTAAYNDGSLNGTLKTASVVGKEDTAAGVFAVQATGRDGRHSHAMRTTVRVAISSRLLVVARELAYKPYFFSQRIIFFSHNKSANSTFSHDLSVKQAQTNGAKFFQPRIDKMRSNRRQLSRRSLSIF